MADGRSWAARSGTAKTRCSPAEFLRSLRERGLGGVQLVISAAMQASQQAVRLSAQRTTEVLGGRAELQEWEIAAMHRVDEGSSASCSRVTWLRTEPESVDRAVDAVRLSLMPKLEDLPGFCSVSVMVRRADGLSVAAVAYDSHEQLERAAEGAREFREDFAPALGVQFVDSAELDVAIAHLRVPETL